MIDFLSGGAKPIASHHCAGRYGNVTLYCIIQLASLAYRMQARDMPQVPCVLEKCHVCLIVCGLCACWCAVLDISGSMSTAMSNESGLSMFNQQAGNSKMAAAKKCLHSIVAQLRKGLVLQQGLRVVIGT